MTEAKLSSLFDKIAGKAGFRQINMGQTRITLFKRSNTSRPGIPETRPSTDARIDYILEFSIPRGMENTSTIDLFDMFFAVIGLTHADIEPTGLKLQVFKSAGSNMNRYARFIKTKTYINHTEKSDAILDRAIANTDQFEALKPVIPPITLSADADQLLDPDPMGAPAPIPEEEEEEEAELGESTRISPESSAPASDLDEAEQREEEMKELILRASEDREAAILSIPSTMIALRKAIQDLPQNTLDLVRKEHLVRSIVPASIEQKRSLLEGVARTNPMIRETIKQRSLEDVIAGRIGYADYSSVQEAVEPYSNIPMQGNIVPDPRKQMVKGKLAWNQIPRWL